MRVRVTVPENDYDGTHLGIVSIGVLDSWHHPSFLASTAYQPLILCVRYVIRMPITAFYSLQSIQFECPIHHEKKLPC
jgi:hypothetical protein